MLNLIFTNCISIKFCFVYCNYKIKLQYVVRYIDCYVSTTTKLLIIYILYNDYKMFTIDLSRLICLHHASNFYKLKLL